MSDSGNGGCAPLLFFISFLLGGVGTALFFFSFPGTTQMTSEMVMLPPTHELVLAYADADLSAEAKQAAETTVQARVDTLARTGQIGPMPNTGTDADGHIVVQFSEGAMDARTVAAALTAPGYLELVDFTAVPADTRMDFVGQRIQTSAAQARAARDGDGGGEVFATLLMSEDILSAEALPDSFGGWMVVVNLTADGASRLGDFTAAHVGKAVAIVLDGLVLSVPVVQARLETPIVISGNFNQNEAQALAAQLSSQPLAATLTVESLNTLE